MPHGKIRLDGLVGETVPRTDQLAVVAAIDAVADERAQLDGDAALEFDGEVGDATPRVELIRCSDGLGWADVDAGMAGAAVVLFRRVGRQRQVDVYLAQEEP